MRRLNFLGLAIGVLLLMGCGGEPSPAEKSRVLELPPLNDIFPPTRNGDPIVYVSVEPCPNGNCRLGHTMANIATALILSELFGWRYLHAKKLNSQVADLFDFSDYRKLPGEPTSRGVGNLEGKHNPKKGIKDPAAADYAGDERWSGHVSFEHVQRAVEQRTNACRKARVHSCEVKLKYSWRISIRRVWLWSSEGFVDPWAAYRVSERLVHAYCKRMAKEHEVYPYLFVMEPRNVSSSTSSSNATNATHIDESARTLSVHARRGDRLDQWVKKFGGDARSITAIVDGILKATSRCSALNNATWTVSVHTEADNSEDLDNINISNTNATNVKFTVHRSNSLVKDLAMMISSDVFVMAPSSLSVLVEGMRMHLSNQTGGVTVHDVRIKLATLAPSKAQYIGDLAGTRMEPSAVRWSGNRSAPVVGFLDTAGLSCATVFGTLQNRPKMCSSLRYSVSPWKNHEYITPRQWAPSIPSNTPHFPFPPPPVNESFMLGPMKVNPRLKPLNTSEILAQYLKRLGNAAKELDDRADQLRENGKLLEARQSRRQATRLRSEIHATVVKVRTEKEELEAGWKHHPKPSSESDSESASEADMTSIKNKGAGAVVALMKADDDDTSLTLT